MATVLIVNNDPNHDISLPSPFMGSVVPRGGTKTFSSTPKGIPVTQELLNSSPGLRALVNASGSPITMTVTEDANDPDINENGRLDASLTAQYAAGGMPSNNKGIIPSARLLMGTLGANTQVVVIGGHTFEYVTALGAAGSHTQIKVQGSAANSRAKLIEAINGTADAANIVEATTPFAVAIVADDTNASVTSTVRIRHANRRGGTAIAGAKTSIALSTTVTAAAWSEANLNSTGKAETANAWSAGSVTITAAMVTAGYVFVELPFTPSDFGVSVLTSAGVPRDITTDAFSIVNNSIKVALAGGGAPSLQPNDVVTLWAIA